MFNRFRRFMFTPLAITLVFIILPFWTYLTLGWEAAWRFGVLLAVLGIADLAIGWGKGLTLSEQVNRDWHRDPKRYAMWVVGVTIGLVLLHIHFTGA